MGAKLTKNKSVSISGKTNEQQKELNTTIKDANNHVDIPVSENIKQTEKKIKKKKEQKLNKKTNKSRVDKSTNTEGYVLASSPFIEQLVGGQVSTLNNNLPLNTSTSQVNAAYQPETSNKDIQELRNACVQERIISIESNVRNQQTPHKHAYLANTANITEESTNDVLTTSAVFNSDYVQSEQQHVES
jgi:hypothetical protein